MTTSHGGFLIPNAEGSLSTKMAEPDQVDFNTLGNSRWGVVTGCAVTIPAASTTATIPIGQAGVAIVNGTVVIVSGNQSITLGAGGSQPRIDLIGVDEAGTLVSIPGSPSADPVYADVPATVTLLAAVYCPVGSANFERTISDKRNILQPVFVGTGGPNDPLLVNRNSGTDTFRIDGKGRIEWNNSDTYMYRTGVASLRIHSTLGLDGALAVTDDVNVGGNTVITGTVEASNLIRATSFPSSAPQGSILQMNGAVYIQTASSGVAWEQLTTASGSNQPGDIKQSMRSPSQMPGWLLLGGQTITESEYPQLFQVDGLAQFIQPGSPRVMTLPDATMRTLLPTTTIPGVIGGVDQVHISVSQLPPHRHGVSIQGGGGHTHSATVSQDGGHAHSTTAGGSHSHALDDPGHQHPGPDFYGANLGYIATMLGGKSQLDGPVNDSSHTYLVDSLPYSGKAKTGVAVTTSRSEHTHQTNTAGAHRHTITLGSESTHTHTVAENSVGGNEPLIIKPPFLAVYTYIKV